MMATKTLSQILEVLSKHRNLYASHEVRCHPVFNPPEEFYGSDDEDSFDDRLPDRFRRLIDFVRRRCLLTK
jgi:hypothetical protein